MNADKIAFATLTVTVETRIRLSFWDALKCRLAGPEVSRAIADNLRAVQTEANRELPPTPSPAPGAHAA